MAVKNHFDGKSFLLWDEEIRTRKPDALKRYREICRDEIFFYEFLQYEFQEQWAKLKSYANEHGVKIMGISRFMWPWTARTAGRIRSCSSLTQMASRRR